MAYSYVSYTGNGVTTQYAIPFGYIRKEHITVVVNGSLTTSWSWVNGSTVQMNSAPASGASVVVARQTPITAPLVDFTDGSTLVAADLDTANLQQLYISQEAADAAALGIEGTATGLNANGRRVYNLAEPTDPQDAATKNYTDTQDNLRLKRDGTQAMTGNLPMGGNKITGLGTPTDPTDAVTKAYTDAGIASANQSAADAAASASAAQVSAGQAAASASAASGSANNAAASAAQAASLARRSVFVGFKRVTNAVLRMTYNSGVGDTGTYATSDFTYKGESQWLFLGEDILATTGNNVGVPRFSLNPAGHLILEI
jgi:Phage T7 tail fibre protein